MYRYNLQDGFPNVCIALSIYLTLPVSNCSRERSFSHLKHKIIFEVNNGPRQIGKFNSFEHSQKS